MEERSTGIILRVRPLTDTSLMVHWLTPDGGRLTTVAKGARRFQSPFIGKLDLFLCADFSFWRHRRSELHLLREVQVRQTFSGLRRDLLSLRQAAYGAALIEQGTEIETPLPRLYALFAGFLAHLEARPPRAITVLAWEMKFLADAGLRPDLRASGLSPGSRQILDTIVTLEWPVVGRLTLSDRQIQETAAFLGAFLKEHLNRIPKGRLEALNLRASSTPT